MTVQELIEKLQEIENKDLNVYTYAWEDAGYVNEVFYQKKPDIRNCKACKREAKETGFICNECEEALLYCKGDHPLNFTEDTECIMIGSY